MTKKELSYLMVATNATLTLQTAENAVNALCECISKAMARGEKVSLPGFGTFSVSRRSARKGRNPKSGEEIKIPARHYARFKPGSDLKLAAASSTVK